jgi:transposase InsO family protein
MASTRLLEPSSVATPWRLPQYAANASANCRSNDRSPRARPDTVQRSDRKIAVTLSHGRTGQCWDNALSESFFASLKGELIELQTWPTRAMARRAVVEYIGWYNGARLHSTLGYRSPAEYEE